MKRRNDDDAEPEDPFGDEPPEDEQERRRTGPEDSETDGVAEPVDGEDELPWIFRRDTVKGERPTSIQFDVLDETLDAESEARRAVEEMVSDREVYLNDFREAAMLAAFENLDDVVAQLREWGYDR